MSLSYHKILVIQTAFIGDAILASALLESLHQALPDARIDILVRKGNESLFTGHPFLNRVVIWDKQGGKYASLLRVLKQVREQGYDLVINLQRFFATGLLTVLSKAKVRVGFDKNPLAFGFDEKVKHHIAGEGEIFHEIQRNGSLLEALGIPAVSRPRLYPAPGHFQKAEALRAGKVSITVSPTSVWFTKQLPASQWVLFMNAVAPQVRIFLLGGPGDFEACEQIRHACQHPDIQNLSGKLGFLESAALMSQCQMNYVNDSAPMHMASALNAPVTAVYCSTIPAFGFGPLAEDSHIVEIQKKLDCRPCGLHGYKACPQKHFECALGIDTREMIQILEQKYE